MFLSPPSEEALAQCNMTMIAPSPDAGPAALDATRKCGSQLRTTQATSSSCLQAASSSSPSTSSALTMTPTPAAGGTSPPCCLRKIRICNITGKPIEKLVDPTKVVTVGDLSSYDLISDFFDEDQLLPPLHRLAWLEVVDDEEGDDENGRHDAHVGAGEDVLPGSCCSASADAFAVNVDDASLADGDCKPEQSLSHDDVVEECSHYKTADVEQQEQHPQEFLDPQALIDYGSVDDEPAFSTTTVPSRVVLDRVPSFQFVITGPEEIDSDIFAPRATSRPGLDENKSPQAQDEEDWCEWKSRVARILGQFTMEQARSFLYDQGWNEIITHAQHHYARFTEDKERLYGYHGHLFWLPCGLEEYQYQCERRKTPGFPCPDRYQPADEPGRVPLTLLIAVFELPEPEWAKHARSSSTSTTSKPGVDRWFVWSQRAQFATEIRIRFFYIQGITYWATSTQEEIDTSLESDPPQESKLLDALADKVISISNMTPCEAAEQVAAAAVLPGWPEDAVNEQALRRGIRAVVRNLLYRSGDEARIESSQEIQQFCKALEHSDRAFGPEAIAHHCAQATLNWVNEFLWTDYWGENEGPPSDPEKAYRKRTQEMLDRTHSVVDTILYNIQYIVQKMVWPLLVRPDALGLEVGAAPCVVADAFVLSRKKGEAKKEAQSHTETASTGPPPVPVEERPPAFEERIRSPARDGEASDAGEPDERTTSERTTRILDVVVYDFTALNDRLHILRHELSVKNGPRNKVFQELGIPQRWRAELEEMESDAEFVAEHGKPPLPWAGIEDLFAIGAKPIADNKH
ncbi:unnamed protein product [Amoebophrya sp. A120]|nr:unnamed protein product [Amoebophrya sp. A120]|eukprot:GSA120T00024595001.1